MLLVVLSFQREKNDDNQMMNPPDRHVCLPLVINVLLLTMIVEMKALRRNMMMTTRMTRRSTPLISSVSWPKNMRALIVILLQGLMLFQLSNRVK
jgi:hypothetical protein